MHAGCKDAQFVLLEGNHDYRAFDAAQKDIYHKFQSELNYAKMLNLKERGVKWVKSWTDGELFKLGNAYFTHGLYTNQYHAKKMVERFGVCIYYGHLHDVMEIPITQRGPDKTLVGKSLGTLCDYKQKYMKGHPSNWQQAFAVFEFFPDGFFQETTIKIFKNRFKILNGKIYDGRAIVKG